MEEKPCESSVWRSKLKSKTIHRDCKYAEFIPRVEGGLTCRFTQKLIKDHDEKCQCIESHLTEGEKE